MTPSDNLLPYDGTVLYFPSLVAPADRSAWFESLLKNVQWKHDEVTIFGKKHITKRQVAWYGEDDFEYRYSNSSRSALPWTPQLLSLKKVVEDATNTSFNSCLLNLYNDGAEGMGYHSDDEKELGKNPVIASVSLGAERKFFLRHRETKLRVDVLLEDGSLLLMKDQTQHHWVHSLPKTSKVKSPRINLTFRQFQISTH